ncbi:hypothetical protein VQ643_04540 [Pseudomonas sp. F1_0610]|uniref:hypothetical protein n=1 Tax=Pseudomonas sp. F1_0610 TaxID=3114284 RepID=UPI0039C2DAD9
MTNLLLIEHMEFASEQFAINDAKFNQYRNNAGQWEFILAFNNAQPVQVCNELAELIQAEPDFEVTLMSPIEEPLEKGHLLYQAAGYCEQLNECLTNFYYFAHENVEKIKIELLEAEPERLKLNLSGMTIVNGSNGKHCDARLTLKEVIFQRDTQLERSFY